jgi:hypothetical protein
MEYFDVERNIGLSEKIERLFGECDPNWDGSQVDFENSVFSLKPHWWGDCTCGYDDGELDTDEHAESCRLIAPNFWYKPTNFQLWWYKYPLRGAYSNVAFTVSQFEDMIHDCVQSIELPF